MSNTFFQEVEKVSRGPSPPLVMGLVSVVFPIQIFLLLFRFRPKFRPMGKSLYSFEVIISFQRFHKFSKLISYHRSHVRKHLKKVLLIFTSLYQHGDPVSF